MMDRDLANILEAMETCAIAVSGGVDSMTLSVFAHRRLGRSRVRMIHASSPAVPPEATARVREWANREGWDLDVIDAGEFADTRYRSNPVNRCFFCKTNLYASMAKVTARQLLSGANTDDLREYRPGLDAAWEHGVRHPYLEAAMRKADVRDLARNLDLEMIAELPSSPCLASRVETAIPIDPDTLRAVHRIELAVRRLLSPATVRCRVRNEGIVIELDDECLRTVDKQVVLDAVSPLLPQRFDIGKLEVAPYRSGSSFVGARR